ncbi:MAG: ABC transporter ATP-binding protein [Oscillospiraceae bacterium]
MPAEIDPKPKYSPFQNVRFILGMLWRGNKGIVSYSMFKAISENVYYAFFVVYLTKYIYTCIEARTPFNKLFFIITVMCGFHVLIHFSSAGHAYYLRLRTPEITRHIFGSVIERAERLPYHRFEQPDFYDKFTRAINDSVNKAMNVMEILAWLIAGAIGACIAAAMVVTVDPILLLFIIPSIFASVYFGAKAGKVYYQLDYSNTRDGRTATYTKRVFYEKKYAGELRLFSVKNVLLRRHKEAFDSMYERTKRLRKKAAFYESVRWGIFVIMSIVAPFFYVAWVVKTRTGADIAAYIAMISALDYTSWNISRCVERIVDLNKNGLFINNLHEFLDLDEEENAPGLHPLEKPLDNIEIRNVSFTYAGASKPTLHNLNIRIKKGERVAFVGHNGAGKTTLVKLLMGLYPVTGGEIVVSGENISHYEPQSYRAHIGTVFQDLQVFALPISQNVLMREPADAAERALVEQALEKAQFGDKLRKLPRGIDTMVSKEFDEEGTVLSGGETQKIAIARIFAKNPDLVILDEPSSALDPIAEYNMYNNMLEIASDKTVIFISHRLSSARIADRIFMLENGTVIEAGTHDALMEQNGKYAAMFRLQALNYQESLPDEMPAAGKEAVSHV